MRRRRVTKAALEHFTMFLREMAFLERVTGNKSNAREWDDDSGDYVVLHSEHVVKEYKRKEALEAENARLRAQLAQALVGVKSALLSAVKEPIGDGTLAGLKLAERELEAK